MQLRMIFIASFQLLLLGLVLGAGFYLHRLDLSKRRRAWKTLAKVSGMDYRGNGKGLSKIAGAPRLGNVQQAITGQVDGAWIAIVDSVVAKTAVGLPLMSIPHRTITPFTYCILVTPEQNLPQFVLRNRSGRGILAGLQSLLVPDFVFEDDDEFSNRFFFAANVKSQIQSLFTKSVREKLVEHPLEITVRQPGDAVDSSHPLEVHGAGNVLTVSSETKLEAKHVQVLVDHAKWISKCLTEGRSTEARSDATS